MSKPVALAIAAHPDDIEFMMAGTLLMLGEAGYELHVLNIANGSCGTATLKREAIIAKRLEEARNAARVLGAHHHDPYVDDLDIFYNKTLLKQVCAVMREVQPTILLTQSPQDYMEDHIYAGRLAVSAAFFRGMRNFTTHPERPAVPGDITVYHALPYGLTDSLRRTIKPGQYVNITNVLARKREALACHKSQKEWLDVSQGLDSYLNTMEDMCKTVGDWSVVFPYAEGWRRHLHLGFCAEDTDPLTEALGHQCLVSEEYEQALREGRFPD